MFESRRHLLQTFILACIAILAAQPCHSRANELVSPAIRTVALTGQAPRGLPRQAELGDLGAPSISPMGHVAFHAGLRGASVSNSNDGTIWLERADGLRLVVRESNDAPSPNSGRLFGDPSSRFSLGDGELAFNGFLNASPNVHAAWVTTSDGLRQINGPGFPVTDADGKPLADFNWTGIGILAAQSSDFLLFQAEARRVNGNDTIRGYWLQTGEEARLLARLDGQAPGAVPGARFELLWPTAMNRSGQFVFQADVTLGGFGPDNSPQGVWTNRDGAFDVLAHSGVPATEFGPDATYAGFVRQGPSINDGSHFLYNAWIKRPGISDPFDGGLVVDDGAGRRVVARKGQSAPGDLPDLVFDRFDLGDSVLNGMGQVAFSARVSGADLSDGARNGIWLEKSPGEIQLIARSGQSAPGGGLFNIDRQQPFVLNNHGQVAFGARLFESGEGIWATDRSGVLQLIVRNGSTIEVAPGDVRTVVAVGFLHQEFDDESSGLQDGRNAAFNNRGGVAFTAFFEDGTSGIFVSSIVAVPEPAMTLQTAIIVLAAMIQRSRRKFSWR